MRFTSNLHVPHIALHCKKQACAAHGQCTWPSAIEARAELLPFRQVVRAIFGPVSKEYRDVKYRQGRPSKTPEPVA